MAAQEKDTQEIEKASRLAHVPNGDEYEKMISGMLYNCLSADLVAARHRARAWAHKYNTYWPEDPAVDAVALNRQRIGMLRDVLGHLGDDEAVVEPPLRLDYGCNVSVGRGFYANFNLTILDCALVTIGDRVLIGPNVSLLSATHETGVQSRRDGVEYARPITIGDDCWIGGHVVVLPGVTIGEGCTIAASSVVTKDIPPWSVAMGSPARVYKKVTPLDKKGE